MGRLILVAYVALIVVFATYGAWWGDYAFKGFWFNFGRALIWPVTFLPSLGELIAAVLLIGIVGALTLRKSR